ncbi:MAG: sigma-70 family RNA polymerase sigma factor [Planctomycetota bacterium]|nr:sigma-70 family RNA polymerase sigma factor [Planctomycetota bacterium]
MVGPARSQAQEVAAGGVAGQEEADEELVRKAGAGDAEAFDALVTRYQDRVYNILARMCGSAEEAEDLAQETFLKAYRALGTFRQGSKFYTWLFRIAVNAAFSRRRQEMRRKSHETGHLDAAHDATGEGEQALRDVVPDPGNSDPAGRLEKEQLREQVRRGLAQLEPDHRAVVLLRDVEGLDYDAIADTLSISRAAVKSRLHRARQELARILKGLRS